VCSAVVAFVLCCVATLAGAARPPVILIPGSVVPNLTLRRGSYLVEADASIHTRIQYARVATSGCEMHGLTAFTFAGLAGSVLETRLRNASSAFAWCPQNQDWTVTWVTLVAAARPDCLLSNLAIYYDEATDMCACCGVARCSNLQVYAELGFSRRHC